MLKVLEIGQCSYVVAIIKQKKEVLTNFQFFSESAPWQRPAVSRGPAAAPQRESRAAATPQQRESRAAAKSQQEAKPAAANATKQHGADDNAWSKVSLVCIAVIFLC